MIRTRRATGSSGRRRTKAPGPHATGIQSAGGPSLQRQLSASLKKWRR